MWPRGLKPPKPHNCPWNINPWPQWCVNNIAYSYVHRATNINPCMASWVWCVNYIRTNYKLQLHSGSDHES